MVLSGGILHFKTLMLAACRPLLGQGAPWMAGAAALCAHIAETQPDDEVYQRLAYSGGGAIYVYAGGPEASTSTHDVPVGSGARPETRPLWISHATVQTERPSVARAGVQAKAAAPPPPTQPIYHGVVPGLPNEWGHVWRTTSMRRTCWHASPFCAALYHKGVVRPMESLPPCRCCVMNVNRVSFERPLPSASAYGSFASSSGSQQHSDAEGREEDD